MVPKVGREEGVELRNELIPGHLTVDALHLQVLVCLVPTLVSSLNAFAPHGSVICAVNSSR